MNNKILYSLIAATFVVGLFTAAYAVVILPTMITLAGDVTITGDMTCTDCIDAPEIATSAVGQSEIAPDAVGASEIRNGAVVGGTGGDIADGTITSADLAPGVGVPIGTVLAWTGIIPTKFGPILPPGFLLADGSSLLRTDFPVLFNLIGTIYGEGADRMRETTFSLPNLRDTFIRGTTVNLGVTGGTAIVDLPNFVIGGGAHTHPVNPPPVFSAFPNEPSRKVSLTLAGVPKDVADDNHRHTVNIPTFDSQSTTHSHDVDIGPTVNEPPFLSLQMIIRAK